eukprot:m.63031 g.63031  ORF g.63031 m.63031 type:complete len:244 (-) comp13827_c0_seq1:57-788(-)
MMQAAMLLVVVAAAFVMSAAPASASINDGLAVRFWWGAQYEDSIIRDATPRQTQHVLVNGTSSCVLFTFDTIKFNGVSLGTPLDGGSGNCSELHMKFANDTELTVFFTIPTNGFSVQSWRLVRAVPPVVKTFLSPEIHAGRHMSYECPLTLTLTQANNDTAADDTLELTNFQLQAHIPHKEASANVFSAVDETSMCQPGKGKVDASIVLGALICGLLVAGVVVFVVHLHLHRRAASKRRYELL